MRASLILLALATAPGAQAKTFQNSYVAFELPDTWGCAQEGVAWTCTPTSTLQSKEAVIVLAAKVAGPEDNMANFLNFLKQPKRITTRVGTPMPSTVSYAQQRLLAGGPWVQAQHLGSEIQDYYTLYLATVKEQLAILISFSAEKSHYQSYNAVFDHAMKTLRIVASKQLLFPQSKPGVKTVDPLGINATPNAPLGEAVVLPPPARRKASFVTFFAWFVIVALVGLGLYALYRRTSKPVKKSRRKSTGLTNKPPRD